MKKVTKISAISSVLEKIGLTTTKIWCVPWALSELYGIEYDETVKMIRKQTRKHWWTPVKGVNCLEVQEMLVSDFEIKTYEAHHGELLKDVPKFKDWRFAANSYDDELTYFVILQSYVDMSINNSHAIIFKNGIVRTI